MAMWVELSPEGEQQVGHLRKHGFSAVNPSMAGWTQRDHQLKPGPPRPAMVYDDCTLIPARRAAGPATVTVPFENLLPEAAEVLLILPAKRVAGCTVTIGQDLFSTTTAVQRCLSSLLHWLNTSCRRFLPLWPATLASVGTSSHRLCGASGASPAHSHTARHPSL